MASFKKKAARKKTPARRSSAPKKRSKLAELARKGRTSSRVIQGEKSSAARSPAQPKSSTRRPKPPPGRAPRPKVSKAVSKAEAKRQGQLTKRREQYAAKKAEAAKAAREKKAALATRRLRALQKRDPKAFNALQRKRLAANAKRRERYAKKKSDARVHKARNDILGRMPGPGDHPRLHGADRADWFVLKAKMRARDKDWRRYVEIAEDEGWSLHEAADEWFSPEM